MIKDLSTSKIEIVQKIIQPYRNYLIQSWYKSISEQQII